MGPRPIKIGYASENSSRNREESSSSKSSSQGIANLIQPFPSAPRSPSTTSDNPQSPRAKPGLPNVPPARYSMALNQAKVKSVLSGDSLVLAAIDNPDRERTLSLAYCTSPHMKKDGDEPFAFEARDALRKLVVGKKVQFKILYSIPNTKREYGVAFLEDGTRLPEYMVEAGWSKLRDDAGRKEDSEDALQQLEKLRLLEAKARAEDKGIWQSSGGHINVRHDMGIRAPTTERILSNGQTQPAEEYGNEARRFVEDRLLQRSVTVDILGLSPQKQLVASVRHPRGSIAKFLLEAGLARCTDHHSTLLGKEMPVLREAEKVAKSSKRGLFKDHVAKASAGGSLEAQVTRVFGPDVIYVRNKAGVEKRINFSSIRGPRQNEAAEAPFRDEAKEFLRKKVIGKQVRISIDGSRPATGEYEAKDVATVTVNDKNINLLMVQEGWCSVIFHRRDDTDRAPNYDELLAAQETAKSEKKGMWSGKAAKAKQYADASESVQKAKMQVATLQRQKKIPAIVDFVKGGSRFVVLVPREGVKLNFVLGGIRAPKSARNPTDKAEPFGQEAHDLATKRLTQRDVEIDVFNIDKVGGFIGALYINKESFAKILVEEGFATVHDYSAEQSGNANELNMAQTRAKEGRKGLWANWDPSFDAEEEESAPSNGKAEASATREKDYREVAITHVEDDGKLRLQIVGTGTDALTTMMTQFKSFHLNSANNAGLPGPPKNGDYVAAKFSEDGQWYRARIRANDRTAKVAEIVYVDYGNSEKMPWSKLRPLAQPQFSPQKIRPQAVEAKLSLVQLPTNKDYLEDAVNYIKQVAMSATVANVDHTAPDGTLYVTLFDEGKSKSQEDSINADLIRDGHGMVPKKLQPWERSFGDVLEDLKKKSEQARDERLGMWEYGDVGEED
ncbi:putative nuclease domain-containing protein 1 [Glarea lozoyensis 74030]|uniref:Probable endonuclease LCL3 n=1 Tax=Glarea lozoyensis (strain ATCC 74030 / MF5533) TaxID=1104152 RepID=H0EMK1_GLAL7|nr:putative nuclease domain-containing protein 1 [Glarea lozoyensis 74030]